ncbi:MAG: DUF4339 domain-containing protein [Thermoleophilia bacterium]|nr:DUF4339 domain-containing protein [Thermoleophilia bacterium]
MSSGWFYVKAGAATGPPAGPVGWAQLVELARTGALGPGDSVWHQAYPGWLPAAQVPGLFPGARWSAGQAPLGPAYQAAAQGGAARPAGRRSPLAWLILLVAVVVVGTGLGLFFGLRGGDEDPGRTTQSTAPPATVSTPGSTTPTGPTTSTERSTSGSSVVGEPGTWLVMLYADADDELIEEDTIFDVNEAESIGSSDRVTIVAQMDRYAGGYDGDGDVSSTKRYLLTEDRDLYAINSEESADVGEVDMGDSGTLIDFATWAIRSYPAEHSVLILSDHGGGWTGGWSDDDPESGSSLTMQEIDDALGQIVADTGIGAFELVGLDACLMGQLEVMSALAPHALYGVGSEETEPLLGWGYAGFLQALKSDPDMTGRELGQAIVDGYVFQDARITDDQARGLLVGAEYTADDVTAELSRTSTMSAIDLTALQDLNAALNDLAVSLVDIDQESVAQARAYAQSYASVFSGDFTPSFIDLGHFVDLLLDAIEDPDVAKAAQTVRDALAQAVTAEAHGAERPGSSGLSLYFPNSAEYSGTFGEWEIGYTSSVGRFATASLWDDYLTFHYTGEAFDPAAADPTALTPAGAGQTHFTEAIEESAPSEDAEIVGPGAGQLTIAPVAVSATEIGPDEVVTLSTEISGSSIAYVYYYVAYYYEEDGSYLTADAGFINSGAIKESGGVYYPDWGDQDVISIEYDWDPTLYFMSDGNEANDQFAFFNPTVYGADYAGDIYTVRGTYTFVDTGTQIDAEIDFSGDGSMQRVWGFTDDSSGAGTWHEISPRPGDTFTIIDEYLDFDEAPEGEFNDYEGGTMTFGDTPFTMVPYYVLPGSYSLAVGVEDLDGNTFWEFTEVTVSE